ncbi:Mitochondrial import inner membrane translocase subunit TIM10 [Hypsizygus marmoreus]|uniref:Mitochondrial import inner membrane translocase subunit n=1 Tax=Hypsizygus marmoreus TaxID=39966 RepID=A0A369K5V0_HYPMA|nr:Mitochondrial import inner membrane translocase subunit TIM10 [Hypsizygus marmoreus]
MSFLGRGPGNATNGGINMDKIDMALTELDTVTDFFNRMVQSCHSKCINARYAEAELNKGESVCIDRCVAKFNDVQKKVGEKLQSRTAANAGAAPGGFGAL